MSNWLLFHVRYGSLLPVQERSCPHLSELEPVGGDSLKDPHELVSLLHVPVSTVAPNQVFLYTVLQYNFLDLSVSKKRSVF